MKSTVHYWILSLVLFILTSSPAMQGRYCPLAAEQKPPESQAQKPPSEEVINLYNSGRDLYGQGKLEEAIETYRKVIELDPLFDYAYGSLGYILYEQKNYDEALAMFEKALSLSPEDAFYHSEIALVYEKLGRRKEGMASLQKATGLKPDNWLYYNNLAVMKNSDGDKEGALAAFEKALSLCGDRKEKKQLRDKIEELKTGKKPEIKKDK